MWNVPYQKCIESGLFIIKESIAKAKDGSEIISRTPMVTGKGQRYFISKFLETRDEEALAAISEEELKLQREDNLFASTDGNYVDYGNYATTGDYKPQLTVEELNALDAQAKEVTAALNDVDDLEALKDENEELEAIADDIEGVDELESIANS